MNLLKKSILETAKYIFRSHTVIKPYLKKVTNLYNMTAEEIDDYNNRKFLEIVNQAYSKSEFYRSFYDEYGVNIKSIKGLSDIHKLPIIDKKIIREHFDSILIGNKLNTQKAHTSGTTGEPLIIRQSFSSILLHRAYLSKYRSLCGFEYGEPLVSLRGHLDSKQFKLKQNVGNILYLSSYQINSQKANDYYNEIVKFKPKAIEGYPSSIYNLCCILKEANLSLNIPLCFTSSETLYEFQRNLFKEILHCETYDWYGCTEYSICLAEDLKHNGYFEMPGYSYNEYESESVITTPFVNPIFPLIRYRMNDIIIPKDNFKKETATDPNIESIEGRTENSIITKSGTLIGRLNFLFKTVNHIKLGQIVQRNKGVIDINIVPEGNFGEKEKSQILKHIDERIGLNDIDVTINTVSDSDIIYTKRNKFNQVVKL